ncbi:TPA: hypothetical protein EYP26_01290 [Candidatus Bathyarchaeota archaeon]|nr:hypothetical protein [Candidatus Bathyarchaeota archaeon]
MVKIVIKEVDDQGRISIPIRWRREWKSKKVTLIKRGNRVEIAPVEPIPPSALFDSIKIPEGVNFADPHSLKKALLKSRGS